MHRRARVGVQVQGATGVAAFDREVVIAAGDLGFKDITIPVGDLGFKDITIPAGDLGLVDYKIPLNESESELWRRKPCGENEIFISFSFVFFHFVKTLVSYLFNILCVLFI